MPNGWSEIFEHALERTLQDIESQSFEIQSEKDIQALLFHHSLALAAERNVPRQVHAEPTVLQRLKPDLVFGGKEIFLEIKLAIHTPRKGMFEAVDKLGKYKSRWPKSRCFFLCIDEVGYYSSPSSKNYLNPKDLSLKGDWRPIGKGTFLLGELITTSSSFP